MSMARTYSRVLLATLIAATAALAQAGPAAQKSTPPPSAKTTEPPGTPQAHPDVFLEPVKPPAPNRPCNPEEDANCTGLGEIRARRSLDSTALRICHDKVGPPCAQLCTEKDADPASCVSPPRVTFQPEPEYTEEARKKKVKGIVIVECVVGADGIPHDVKVTRKLGKGLDEKAVKAIQKWRFEPARRAGQPVPTLVSIEVNFRLY